MFRRIYLLAGRTLILGTLVSLARADSHIASPGNQRFHQGDISPASNAGNVFFSCEAGDVGGGTGNHVPIIVSAPAGVNFDTTLPLPTYGAISNSISPPAQGTLGAVSFLDATHLQIAMGTNFKPGDNFTLSGLRFTNFTPGSVPDFMRESVNNQSTYGYIDSFSVRVGNNPIAAPSTGPGVSQILSPGATAAPCSSITITEPNTSPANGGIWATTGIMITIPSGLGVTWDNTVTLLTGLTNTDVSANVGYTDMIAVNQFETAVITVKNDFTPGEAVILNGLRFNVSPTAADNPGFPLNIRIGGTNNNQTFHAQCCNIQISGVPHISSTASQTFTVGDLPTSATPGGPITITETSGSPKMTAGRHVQVVIPSALKAGWNPLFTPTTSATGSGVVGTATITTTSQANDTIDIPVTTSFSSNDQLLITAAQFSNFTQRSGPASLQLFVTGTTLNPQPTDDKTRAIGQPTLSSQSDQDFLVSPPGPTAVLMAPITITDDATTPRLTGGSAISIRIPASFAMQWGGTPQDPPGSAVLTGALSGAGVAYQTVTNPNDTLVITPVGAFGAGGSGTISGLHFGPFTAASTPANLHLFLTSTNPASTLMADNHIKSIGGRPTISTGSNQAFTVNDPSTVVTPFTIQDSPTNASILSGNTLQVIIPASLQFTWDNSITTPTLSGSAAGKVTTPFSYSVDLKTLKIPVTTSFNPSDTLTLTGLQFMNFSAASPPAGLQVTVTATGPVAATDAFTKAVGAPTLASAANQSFGKNDPSTLMQPITITDDSTTPRLLSGTSIQVWIPPSFNMTWDPAFPPVIGVTGTGAVGAPSFANGNKTLVIPVTTSFTPAGPGQTVTITGGHFSNFTGISGASSLELFLNTSAPPALPNAFDSRTITVGTRPTVLSVTTRDVNGNGSIDHLVVVFSEPIASTSSVTSGLGFTAAGYTILGGGVSGSTVTLALQETGLPDTGAIPALTYNPAVGNLVDSTYGLGLNSLIPPTQDGAAPVIIGFSAVDPDGDGHLDTITFTFSENLAPGFDTISNWQIFDANGSTNLLAGLTNSSLQITNNQLVITLSGTTGTDGRPRYRYQNLGGPATALQDASGNTTGTQTNNLPPAANAGSPQTLPPTRVTLNASGSTDPNGAPLTYAWSFVSGPATVTPPPGTGPTSSLLLITPGVYTYKVTVSDGLDTASATTTVTILNSAPTAVAIINSTINASPNPVTLYGALSSDVDGDSLSYLWTQVGGPSVTVNTPTGVDASFVAAAAGVYRFQLAVSDLSSNTSSDQIVIRVHNGASVVPTADAGANQVCKVGTLVTLDGRRSTTPSGNALTYSWTPTGLFTGSATIPNPTFRPPGPGQYTFQLIVTDSVTASVPATVTVLAYAPGNLPPLAVANKLLPAGFPIVGDTVTLDSSGSLDPEGAPLQYAWSQVGGPTAFLSSPSVAQPTFTPVFSGTYSFQLVVSDGVQQGFPALTSFQVLPSAGTTPVSITPTLMSATLLNGHVLSTTAPISLFGAAFPLPASTGATDTWWEQVLGPAVVFNPSFTGDNPASGIVQFTPPVAGLYRFRLNAVNFLNHLRTSATLDVVVDTPALTAPVANAGPAQTAVAGQTVTLSSSNSVGTGANTLYSWTQVLGPPVALSDPSSPNPTFVPLSAGTYVFSLDLSNLTANQTGMSTSPSLVQVTVGAAPAAAGGGGGGGGGGCGTLGLEPLAILGLAILIRRRY